MQIEERVPLAPKTTFQIGGPARFFVRAQTLEDVRAAVAFAHDNQLPLAILGGGSNVLVGDEGFDGLVIQVVLSGISLEHTDRGALLTVAAGESWDEVVAYAVNEDLWGLENLSGIPGTVGGAVVQNIGAYGAALSQTLIWVEALDSESGELRTFSNATCGFGYRESLFKKEPQWIVLRAGFALTAAPAPNLTYKDLAECFAGAAPALPQIRETVLEIRRQKFPDLSTEGTAGSFFKNPIVSSAQAATLKEKLPNMPLFVLPETEGVKVPLAYLLDKGLGLKGERVGGARLFERQPLVIAARRGTSAHEVDALAHLVMQKIFDAYRIMIEPEVCTIK